MQIGVFWVIECLIDGRWQPFSATFNQLMHAYEELSEARKECERWKIQFMKQRFRVKRYRRG